MMAYSRDQSLQMRTTGNEFYAKSLREGLAPTLRCSYLQEALTCYQRALIAASPSQKDMMASACKNLGKSNERLFKMVETEEKEHYHLRECFYFYSNASEYGRCCMEKQ